MNLALEPNAEQLSALAENQTLQATATQLENEIRRRAVKNYLKAQGVPLEELRQNIDETQFHGAQGVGGGVV